MQGCDLKVVSVDDFASFASCMRKFASRIVLLFVVLLLNILCEDGILSPQGANFCSFSAVSSLNAPLDFPDFNSENVSLTSDCPAMGSVAAGCAPRLTRSATGGRITHAGGDEFRALVPRERLNAISS